MTPTEITAVIGTLATVIAGIVVPSFLRRRKDKMASGKMEILSWESMNKALARERDDLRKRLDDIERHHIEELKLIRTEFDNQLATARQRIHELESDVVALRRILSAGGNL